MDLLEELKKADKDCLFFETKNFYYENHNCEKSGDTIKVSLDFTLSHDVTDKILRFGKCPKCGEYFYHYDYNSKTF